MYLREAVSKPKRGPDVTYVQLCESESDAERGSAKTRILHSFGRKDALDLKQIARLQEQLAAYLEGEQDGLWAGEIDRTGIWHFGGPDLLDGLWRELELDRFFGQALQERRFEAPLERALLNMVAQRAMDFLAEAMDELREHLYFQVTDLLNANVSVRFI